MKTERYKQLTEEIMECALGYEPAEYQAALTLAVAFYFKAMFPHDLEGTYKQHIENLRYILEEMDAKTVIDIKGVDLDRP